MRSALTLGEVYAWSCYGRGSIVSARLKSHNVSQGVQRKGLCGGLLTGHCGRFRFYPHNLGRYNYLFQAHHLQMLGIQGFDNPSVGQVLVHPSSSGVTHLCHEPGLPYQLQRKPLWIYQLASGLWAYLSKKQQSWLASLVNKGYQLKSPCPSYWQRFWLLPLASWQDCLSGFLKLNQVVCSYFIIPQTRVGCKP